MQIITFEQASEFLVHLVKPYIEVPVLRWSFLGVLAYVAFTLVKKYFKRKFSYMR